MTIYNLVELGKCGIRFTLFSDAKKHRNNELLS